MATALIVVTAVFAFVAIAASYWSQRDARLARLQAETATIADQLAVTLASPVWSFDDAQIDEVLDGAMTHVEVYGVELRLADRTGTRYGRVRDERWLSRATHGIAAVEGILKHEREIRFGDAVLGKVTLHVTRRFEDEQVRQLLVYTVAIIVGLTALLGACLYFVLWRIVIRPLKALERQAGAISAGRQSQIGGETGPRFAGEIERLRLSLHDMLGLLNQRYEDLKRSEARLQALLKLTADWYWEQDEQFRFVRIEGRGAPLAQTSPERYFGKTRWELPLLGITDEQWAAHKATLAAHLPFRGLTHQLLDPEKGLRTLTTSGEPIFDEDGRFRGYRGVGSDITELTRASEALNRTEARMRALADNLPNGMVFQMVRESDGTRRFQYVSAGVERIHGVTPEAVLRDANALLGQVVEEDRVLLRPAGDASSAAMNEFDEVMRIRRPDGELRWLRIAAAARTLADGRMVADGFSIDITALKLAEAELELSRARMAAIIESAMDAIITVDENQRIVVFNHAAEEIMHCTAAQAMGQMLERFIPPRFRAAHTASLQRFGANGATSRGMGRIGEIRGLRWDGEEFPMEASISKTSLNGQLFYTVILRDITARRREDAERGELEARLRQSQKMEAIGTLAGGIAHDFNNMLAVISGNIELALRDVEPGSKTHARLEEIEKAGRRAKDLVRQILTFSRPQKVERDLVDLRKAVEESLRMLEAALPASVELRSTLAPDTPLVAADPTQVHQILANLCTNAWHAMDGRPGVIEVKLDRLMVAAGTSVDAGELRPGLYARLEVADNGVGMDAATLSRIFEPFFTTKPAGLGTGLGLSVVHGIVQSHSGRIGVHSEPGRGTRVTVFLPAVEATGVPGAKRQDGGEPRRAGRGGEHVLFLDDEEAIVAIATELLRYLGYRVTGCTVPKEAVAALTANPDDIDVAITDFNMPDSSGLEVAGQFRQIRPDLPIIIASGYLSDDLTRAVGSAGLQAVLAKPVSGDELARTIRAVLDAAANR